MGAVPSDLAAYLAQQRRLREARANPAQRAATAPTAGTAGRRPSVAPAPAPAPADEPAPAPAAAPAPAPASVVAEQPVAPARDQELMDRIDVLEGQLSAQTMRVQAQFESNQESAYSIIQRTLAEYGLEGLEGFVNRMVFQENVIDANVLIGEIRQTEQYKKRFAGNIARRNAGLNVLSEAEYLQMENAYRQLMRQSGLPVGFYDNNDDFTNLIANDVSIAELAERVNQGYEAVMQADPAVVDEMRRLYGIGDGDLAAYFLDPERGTPNLLQQARAAQVAGQAVAQAGMQLTVEQAEELARAGVTGEQARAGFQAIEQAEELFAALPGQTGEMITEEEQVAGVFGTSAAAQQRIRRRTRERQAEFEAGGGFAAQGSQVTGLT